MWEANHVWLIFCLVMLWTGFPSAFAAIMTTLYIPLGLAALGIVLRGCGFAFRKVVGAHREQRVDGAAFAGSSVITPFFFGTVAGGIASGRVPDRGHGDPLTSWLNPTSLLGGVLAVVVCALPRRRVPHRRGPAATPRQTSRRGSAAGPWRLRRATGAVALAGHRSSCDADAPRLFDGLLGRGLPLRAGLRGLRAGQRRPAAAGPRPGCCSALAVARPCTVVVGWGVAQYPYLLGTHLSIDEAAAPDATLIALTLVAAAALLLVVPATALLFFLHQRGRLDSA